MTHNILADMQVKIGCQYISDLLTMPKINGKIFSYMYTVFAKSLTCAVIAAME